MIFWPWEFTYLIYDVEAPKEQESLLLLLVVYYRILMQHNMKRIFITNKLQEGPLGFIACAGKDQNLLEHSLLLLGTGNPRELQIRLCIFTFTILSICVLYC